MIRLVAPSGVEPEHPFGHENLNLARLPISPRGQRMELFALYPARHASARGGRGPKWDRGGLFHELQPRSHAAASARRPIESRADRHHLRRFDMQPVVRLAFRGQQHTAGVDDLLKNGHMERRPQLLALRFHEELVSGPRENNQRVSQRWDFRPHQRFELRPCRCDCGRLKLVPGIRSEYTNGPNRTKPRLQHGRAWRRRNRVNQVSLSACPSKTNSHSK
jgi:hypothetical protein